MALAALTDEQLEALPAAKRDEYLSLLEETVGGESLPEFICRLTPHHPPPRHFAPVIEVLQQARVEPVKVGISMPPGHGKTTLILNAFAWWLSRHPGDTNAYYSYNEKQGLSKSALARELTQRAGIGLSDETNSKGEWRTTKGGGLLAGGVGSGLTGQRVQGLLVVDDPFNGPLDAYSPTQREAVDEWFKSVALTRRAGASTIVVHTRWHEDDLLGRLKKRGWKIINLPAIAEKNDPLGRAEGEPLWGEVYGLDRLLESREEGGEFNFASLFQGSPRPRGGSVFGEPHYYDPATTDFEGCRIVLAADPAASTRTSADYSVAVVLFIKGLGSDAVAYVRRVYRQQVPIPQFANDLLGLQAEFGETEIGVESVGGFKAIPQMLQAIRPGLRIKEIIPIGDKFTRAQPAAAAWNTGRILVPSDSSPWLGPFLDEIAKFTGVNDRHDDQVDGLAHAWNNQDGIAMWDVL
jgi:predicted phage terminase large subunit-like protein